MDLNQGSVFEHELNHYLSALSNFHSQKSLERSSLYQALKTKVSEVLGSYELKNWAPSPSPEPFYRAVAWNVERGMNFEGLLHVLATHPIVAKADIHLFTEIDLGMARSGNRNVTRELAEKLGMNYFFVPSYFNISKGCGIESEFEGENTLGIQGNSILSRYPIEKQAIVALPSAVDKMKGREKRLGQIQALIATIDLDGRSVRAACVHLDQRSSPEHRRIQMERVIKALNREGRDPILMGGDWNTHTYDTHSAISAIVGFWIRVARGVKRSMKSYYPHPDKFFERRLFNMLEQNGFDYKSCNVLGGCTFHYSTADLKQYKSLGEWIPGWGFRFLERVLEPYDGQCSFKLDWFAQKGLRILGEGERAGDRKGYSISPRIIGNLTHNNQAVSDHDPIVLDFCV
jgi:endonuclease/exonuclease/phosphatase family metal-dependent hydrolase